MGAVHFVGFRGDEYLRAVRLYGRPDFIHQRWDQRCLREIAVGDVLIFARGTDADPPAAHNGSDIAINE
jgi:Na+(H+)/acetate symporter ActP